MASPNPGNLVTFAIKINGTVIPDTYQVFSIRINQAINQISSAAITLLDGAPSSENFPISESSTFVPGNAVSIELGYDGENTVVFEGMVSKQGLRVDDVTGPRLVVDCTDQSIKLNLGRKNRTWQNITDSAVIETVIANAGLSSMVTETSVVLPDVVQYYTTDWDFMLSRANANSLVVSTINNKVKVFNPSSNTASVLTLTYGLDIDKLETEINALTQLPKVTASAWDYQQQQVVGAEAINNLPGAGNLSSTQLASIGELTNFELQTTAPENKDQLQAWANAQMLYSELSKITGTVRFSGDASLVPGKYLSLAGCGARFNGDHFVSAVNHEIADGCWITEAEFGLSQRDLEKQRPMQAAPTPHSAIGCGGLFNAVVKKIEGDPENEYRVLVEVALLSKETTGLWARLSNLFATNGHGALFLPEIGDEVIVGFLNQDPRYPIILGSLYSQNRAPSAQFKFDDANSLKGIVTRNGLSLVFDDENKILRLTTANNNSLELSDKDKQVSIKDENDNCITMSNSGITIKSRGSICLEAAQGLTIKGNTGVTIESNAGDVSTEALNIKETANIQYSAQGRTEASVEGGATLTLKAAMVMIN